MTMNTPILTLSNLCVARDKTRVLHDISLSLPKGTIHMIMGPNGSGKSTLLNAIMGNPVCAIESGAITLNGEEVQDLETFKRARHGMFMAFQNPVGLSGVPFAHVIQAAREAIPERFSENEQHLTPAALGEMMRAAMARVGLDKQFTYRSLNEGFSGGEKKKAEVIQMMLLKPSLALLDEIDSGLDIDALRSVCDVLDEMRLSGTSFLIVTHNPKVGEYIKPDRVHILTEGRIVKSGTLELAREVEARGYDSFHLS